MALHFYHFLCMHLVSFEVFAISLQPNRPTTLALAWIEAQGIPYAFESANNDDVYALEPIEQVENGASFAPLFVCQCIEIVS